MSQTVTVLVVDDRETHISLHADEEAAVEAVRANYAPEIPADEFDLDMVTSSGVLVYISTQNLPAKEA